MLNPCSRCRAIILSVKQTKNKDSWYVVCGYCGKTGSINKHTREQAIERWNKKNPYIKRNISD